MMVADTSALMAVVNRELESQAFADAMIDDGEVLVSTATAVEFVIVAMNRGDEIHRSAVDFLERPFVQWVPLDDAQLWVAVDAHRRFGRGRHPASLNFGDTFAYPLASVRRLPLLFKGDDFAQTDIISAAAPA